MKNTLKVLGIIAMVAVIGFSMAACDDGSDDDNGGGGGSDFNGNFAGSKWEHTTSSTVIWRFTFTTATAYKEESISSYGTILLENGTYTVSGNTVAFTSSSDRSRSATRNGNTLTLGSNDYTYVGRQ